MRGPDDGAVVPLLLGAHWHTDQPGGLPRYLADLFDALRAAGMHPRATVAGPAFDAPVGVAAAGHLAEPMPSRLAKFAMAASRAASGVDVVDAHFAYYAFLPTVLGRLRRLPLVVHFQGPWADESVVAGDAGRLKVMAKRQVEGAVYRRASAVVVLSEAFKRVVVERYGVAPWRVHVVPPGVALDRFTPGDRRAARRRLGVPQGELLVLAVRRLVPRMGLDVLVDAWAKVRPSLAGGRLVIVGEGPDRGALRARADASGTGDSIRLVGGTDDQSVVDWYRAADLSVVPTSALEGFGLVVLESLACGTPTIVTGAGGLPEAVRGLDPGVIVPAGDVDALATRLQAAVDGTRPLPGRDECRSHAAGFGWPEIARRHGAIYADAARAGPAGRIRVVFVDHCAKLSGGELALLRLLPALDGVDAHVVLGEHGPLVGQLHAAGVSVEVLELAEPARALRRDRAGPATVPAAVAAATAGYSVRLAARLRRLRPDVVHTNSLKAALYGGLAGRLAGVPVVWHVRDRLAGDYLPDGAAVLVRRAARVLPRAVIANSRATLATLGSGLPPAAVVPSPVDAALLRLRPPALEGGSLRVGMVGRLAPWKGQHVFLEAFAAAFGSGEAEAVVVGSALFGETGYEADLGRLVGRLGIGGRVVFRGFCDDIGAELAGLDVLVHASTVPEPFGQVVVEGMAAGLAVVAAGAGGPAELVRDGANGLLHEPGDAASLAAALRRLADDPDLRRRLGREGRARAADYTPERIAPLVHAVYQEVLGR